MNYRVSGSIYAVFETKQVTERFQKRDFVLETSDNPNYPQHVLFQLTGDRCDQIDTFTVGDNVSVEFSLRGRQWTSPQGEVRYFNSLDVWAIVNDTGSSPEGMPGPLSADAEDQMPF